MNKAEQTLAVKRRLHELLLKLWWGDEQTMFGICNYVLERTQPPMLKEIQEVMNDIFIKWPKFSGDKYFPVVGMYNFHNTPKYEYFDNSTEGGRLRLELLEFMIKELEK